MDSTFDVTDVCNQTSDKNRLADPEKTGKVNSKSLMLQHAEIMIKRADALYAMVEEIIKDLVKDDIMGTHTPYFTKQPGQTCQFHHTIKYAAHALVERMKQDPQITDDSINSRILSLLYSKLEKYWKDFEVYLFPFAKQVKGLGILEEVVKKT